MARFPRYSFNNCILIAIQHPEATLVQGFHAWRKLGRSVQKGQKGIGIIAPMIGRKKDDEDSQEKSIFGFKVVHVFDVSQTEGDGLPEFAEVSGEPGAYLPAPTCTDFLRLVTPQSAATPKYHRRLRVHLH